MAWEYYFVQSIGPGKNWDITSAPTLTPGAAIIMTDRFVQTNNLDPSIYNSIEIRVKNQEHEWKIPYGQLLFEAGLEKVAPKHPQKGKDIRKLDEILKEFIKTNRLNEVK